MSNQIGVAQKPTFTMMIRSEGAQKLINDALGNTERKRRFVAALTSAVTTNPELQKCTPQSILQAAFLGEALNLSPSPQLGYYYLVPFKKKAKYENKVLIEHECMVAQFVLGYKGYIQLAIRSGKYEDIDVTSIKEGNTRGAIKARASTYLSS